MSDKVYNLLKYLSAIALPALATLIIAIGEIWGLPIMAPIAATVTAVAAFLGALIVKSSLSFFKDKEIVTTDKGVYGDGEKEEGEVNE